MRFIAVPVMLFAACGWVLGQTGEPSQGLREPVKNVESQPENGIYVVKSGTRVPLALINSVSTKHSSPGDRIYLESVFPILVNGKIVIPPGSYFEGTVTQVKRPGRVKGRGAIFIRFDSMILPNGVTRDFRARVGGLDGRSSEDLDRKEGKITSEGNKAGDARTVGEAAAGGATVGAIAGSAAGSPGMGVGIGAAAGAAAGLAGVLLSRGPDAVLARGTQLDMVLDRDLTFNASEINFPNGAQPIPIEGGPVSPRDRAAPPVGRRFPY
ncbi:MAG TPA: hypothetical protein VFA54_12020 [Bryobacterales bacterium]|jgi:hypothetical protein|nr:hypothetical protein [Bryobacterales bacterium]